MHFYTTNPPFGEIICPVIKDALLDARKVTTPAISEGVPFLHSGVSSAKLDRVSSPKDVVISVVITPGATQFTLIFDGPTSWASAFVKPIRPAFEAEYTTSQEAPVNPQMEDTLIITKMRVAQKSFATPLKAQNVIRPM